MGIDTPHSARSARVRGVRRQRSAALPITALVLAVSILCPERRASGEQVITVATRHRVTQAVVIVRPPGKPVATVVVLVGGAGKLDLTPVGLPRTPAGLLVARREQLARRGFVVALPDAPSDRAGEGLLGFRTGREHSVDIGAVMTQLRRDDPASVWLVGLSMGTVSAASVTARLGRDGPDGLVLVSSVTVTHPAMRESLRDVPLESIRVPTLVIHHRDDPCEITPYGGAAALTGRLTGSPRAELVTLEGGQPRRGLPCGPESPHAFFGIEDDLIARLASWITHASVR